MDRSTIPLPQYAVFLHGAPAFGHVQPASTLHAELHPSLSTLPPSSHSSPAEMMASPQMFCARVHFPPVPSAPFGHVYPGSTVQFDVQPSPLTLPPSSQD